MDINASIIDQHVRGLEKRQRLRLEEEIGTLDDTKALSASFVVLCVKTLLDLTEEEAIDRLTEGGGDFGVDALDIGDIIDGEFVVTLFQGKYKERLDGVANFEQKGVEKAVLAVRTLFDPHAALHVNPRLGARLEEIRSLILDGNLPRVRFLLCNNGASWKEPEAQAIIDAARLGERVEFRHVNHEILIRILGSTHPIKDSIQFVGKDLVEDLNYVRVLVGKVPVTEIARLMAAHGDRILDRNVRRYLGLTGNRVNEAIRATLRDEAERANFFFYNNGLTLVCDRFDYNALQPEHHKVRVEGLQIINGAQTSKTIQITVEDMAGELPLHGSPDTAHVLVRLYQVPRDAGPDVQRITYATNNQNPVDLKDLRSGDERQRKLEQGIEQLGYDYRRQRSDSPTTPKDITVSTAAEAVLAVWREKPQRAKFRAGDHFSALYDEIFRTDLNAAQVVCAVLLFRFAENKRKRPPVGAPEFVRYASYFIAMLMGRRLLAAMSIPLEGLDHRNFEAARRLIDENAEAYFQDALHRIDSALKRLYNGRISPQRLSATFRRGDLFDFLGDQD